MPEVVALVDASGAAVGRADRSAVRRQNLMHATTSVMVRDARARIYVHRRSPDKDWAPGACDVAAGGVLRYGEEPLTAARRELAEELGITKAKLLALGGFRYEGETSRCVIHAFETTWTGAVRHADGEVVWGDWWTLAQLDARLADPAWPFVPDTRALLARLAADEVADYAALPRAGLDRASRIADPLAP